MGSLRLVIGRLADRQLLGTLLIAGLVLSLLAVQGVGSNEAVTSQVGSAAWALELLSALPVNDQRAPDTDPYERDDYDGWSDADGDCQSARHEVLIEESLDPVTFTNDRECKVATGRWVDPYTGDQATTVDQASIDHVVSLSEAHHSGAWAWPRVWKRAFSNDIEDPATLAVSLRTVNQNKGSSGPSNWLPEPPDARCAYAIARVRINTRWQLSVSPPDRQALERQLTECVDLQLPSVPIAIPLEIIDFDADPPVIAARPTPRITPDTCDARYSHVCLPMSLDDLDCADIDFEKFKVTGTDPHNLDGNDDGVACEGP